MGLNEYLNSPGYAAAQEWMGHGDALRESWAKWKAGDLKAAAAAIPDDLLDSLVVHGPAEECREKLQRYFDNGVDTIVLDMNATSTDIVMDTVRSLAPR